MSEPPHAPPPGHGELVERVQALPRRRTYLLPALHLVQDDVGWLPEWGLELVGAHLRVPKSEVYGIASSFPELRLAEPQRPVVRVCTGASCRGQGASGLRDELRAASVACGEFDCLYVCGVGPVVEIDGRLVGRASAVMAVEAAQGGESAVVEAARHVEAAQGGEPVVVGAGRGGEQAVGEVARRGESAVRPPAVAATGTGTGTGTPTGAGTGTEAAGVLVQDGTCSRAVGGPGGAAIGTLAPRGATRVGCAGNCWQAPSLSRDGGQSWQRLDGSGGTWTRPGMVRLLRDVGVQEPLGSRAYGAFERAQQLGSDGVWQVVKDAGLRGRGGAYFPVGTKWETARSTAAERRFLLVNAEEGEPGIYKDRHLLEGDPQRIVEGVQIAALGIGATEVVIFVNGEAHLAQERLLAALEQARQVGALAVPVEVRLGAGGYVQGEETALINAIHGLRSEPLARPPFPAVSGLFASPTVINNVETLANLPDIILEGADWFRQVGTPSTPGTKLVSLAGAVRRPGLYEVAVGTPLGSIIADCGGGPSGELGAVLVGGPSGSILPVAALETPFDVQPLQAIGGVLGAGGIVPITTDQCPVAAVRELIAYNARESCGKCTPCREGTVRLLDVFDGVRGGHANGRGQEALETIDLLNDVLGFGSLCGLGQMTPNPVRALLRHFPTEIQEHLAGVCRAGVCIGRSNGVA